MTLLGATSGQDVSSSANLKTYNADILNNLRFSFVSDLCVCTHVCVCVFGFKENL